MHSDKLRAEPRTGPFSDLCSENRFGFFLRIRPTWNSTFHFWFLFKNLIEVWLNVQTSSVEQRSVKIWYFRLLNILPDDIIFWTVWMCRIMAVKLTLFIRQLLGWIPCFLKFSSEWYRIKDSSFYQWNRPLSGPFKLVCWTIDFIIKDRPVLNL